MTTQATSTVRVPRIAIEFCTQCKWNLRAAYFAQELLQTFGTSIGEIALIPVTGGTFTVTMTHATASTAPDSETPASVTDTVIWDRKTENGFPETKELKNRVRNIIEPDRDLGHIDRRLKKDQEAQSKSGVSGVGDPSVARLHGDSNGQQIAVGEGKGGEQKECEDCK
ncbi:hypothetical protein PV11_01418 [Exophiala sideris]|uniref:Selenoprotein W-like protein n=1 Tax=Exophiala sideris TaxID=1016849 RepID=A0A0D1ZG61_9EURO|nr:hypothetical protein PV11_01418 [Exophiala sideris]